MLSPILVVLPPELKAECRTLKNIESSRLADEDGCIQNTRPVYAQESVAVDHEYGFTIHYTASIYDSRMVTEAEVERLAELVRQVMDELHGEYRFRRPPSDATDLLFYCDEGLGPDGGDGNYDIYLINDPYVYGYARPTSGGGSQVAASYLALSNWTFDSPGLLEVTLAHEYFHAIEFAYDRFEDLAWMESSAIWAEEALFNEVNDYLQYVKPAFDNPELPVNHDETRYAMGIWARFHSEQLGWQAMRPVWETCSQGAGNNALDALQGSYDRSREGGFSQALLDFRVGQVDPRGLEEGDSYPPALIHKSLDDLDNHFSASLAYTGAHVSQWGGGAHRIRAALLLDDALNAKLLWQSDPDPDSKQIHEVLNESYDEMGLRSWSNLPSHGLFTLVVVNTALRGNGNFELFLSTHGEELVAPQLNDPPEALGGQLNEGFTSVTGCGSSGGGVQSSFSLLFLGLLGLFKGARVNR